MTNQLKFAVLLLVLSFTFTQCTDITSDAPENEQSFAEFQKSLNESAFTDVVPFDFEVDWGNPVNGFSKELQTAYYEFPIIKETKISTELPSSRSQQSPVAYKIIVYKNSGSYEFYVLKFLGAKDTQVEGASLTNLKSFSGQLYLINNHNENIWAKKYSDGDHVGTISFISHEKYNALQESKQRLTETCYTETTYYYIDWYQEYADGSTVYLDTELDDITYSEVCYVEDDQPGGGGGNGGGTGSTYYEYEPGIAPQNVLSINPKVKYPDGSNYDSQYPKLTEYLRNQLPSIKDNNHIINALVNYGDLSAEEIKEQLKWGQGPIIEVLQLDDACSKCNPDTYGLFRSTNTNTLFIDMDLVNDLENTTPGSELADSFSFLVGVTILHELVHFSEFTDGAWNNPESGLLFEQDAYGQTVWRENTSIILKKWKNQ